MKNIELNLQTEEKYNKTKRKNSDNIKNIDSSDKEEKEQKLDFEELHEVLLDCYNRKKYRKIFEFIDTKEQLLRQINITNRLFFSHMKMNCILKIINKKFNKYHKSSQIKGIEKWFKFADALLYKFSLLISKLYKQEVYEQCEYIILYHIKIYYYHSLYSKFKNDNKEFISYLILSEELIKKVIDRITLPETFIYIIRTFLLLSNLLIQGHSIYSAINYLITILHIIKVVKSNEIELQIINENIKLNDNLFITSNPNVMNVENIYFKSFISEINFLSAITYCLLGVSFEFLNEFFLSNSCYNYAKFITEGLVNNNSEYNNLLKLLEELSNKSKKEKDIIIILCKLDMVKFINKYKYTPEKKGLDSFENKKFLKYKKVEKKLAKLKLKESEQLQDLLLTDDNEKNQKSIKIKLMTNNVILLNYLSSEQFKPVIYQIKNMNIYNMDKETEMLITKKLEMLKNKNKKKSSKQTKLKRYHSKDSLDFSNNISFNRIRKVRSRKRFQTEFNKNLIGLGKVNAEKIKIDRSDNEDRHNNILKFSAKDVMIRNPKEMLSLKNKRKLSFPLEFDGSIKNNNSSLNESSFIGEDSSSNKKSLSKSNNKNSETDNSFLRNNINIKPYKISFNCKDTDINKKANKIENKKRKNKVPKPLKNKKLDKYIFNKIYIKKLEHIEKLTNKEYKFQKGILRNKSYERFPDVKFDPDKEKKDAEFFYIKTLDEKLKMLEEKIQTMGENKKRDFYLEKRITRKIMSFQNRVCTSLNYKDKEKYSKFIKDIDINWDEKEIKKPKNKDIYFLRSNSQDIDLSNKKINENNNVQMNILGGKIEKIERKITNKLTKAKNVKKNVKYFFPEIRNINNIHRNQSSKGLRKNLDLIEEFINKKSMSLKLGKDLVEKNRKSACINNDNLLLL